MSTYVFYVDESYDKDIFCLSALAIRDRNWLAAFDEVREFRRQLKRDHGILLSREIHATDFVAGRGRLGPSIVTKRTRSQILRGLLQLTARLHSAMLFNVCLKNSGLADAQMTAWDRLINRIERTMRRFEDEEQATRTELVTSARATGLNGEVLRAIELRLNAYRSRAVLVADEGRESEITAALRRMHVHNPIPSQYGRWETGGATKNITTARIVEDPVFKASERSYFLQIADCVAFSLLKRETPNKTALATRADLGTAFEQTLSAICYRKASPSDPLGIVRK